MSTDLLSSTAERGRSLLTGIAAQVDELRQLEHALISTDELLDLTRHLETVARSLFAVQVTHAGDLERRGAAAAHSSPSTASFLRDLLRIPAHDARLRVAASKAVHEQHLPSGEVRPPVLPVLRAALDSGYVDRSHLQTVLVTMNDLRDSLDQELRDESEQQLIAYAMDMDPDQFRKVAAHLGEIIDPDGTPDQPTAFAKAEFTIGVRNNHTGLTGVSGRLDDLSIEALRLAIDALAAPKAAVDGIKDLRPAATRRAHAFIEIVTRAVTHTDLPTHGGRRPQVNVTLNWDVANSVAGTAITDSGITLTPASARRVLCDAAVVPAVLGSRSEVLDLGRSSRTFSRAIRTAITLRDRGCAFPGCDRPPGWTDVHHIRFWDRDLGPTSYDNGCLLCTFHHTEIHREQWHAQMSVDGHPEFIPPRWLDPHQRPRRNTLHHLAPEFGAA